MKTRVSLVTGSAIIADPENVQILPHCVVVDQARADGTIQWIPWGSIRDVLTTGITEDEIERQESAQRAQQLLAIQQQAPQGGPRLVP